MKKRLLALLLCGVLSLSVLTACGDSSADDADTNVDANQEQQDDAEDANKEEEKENVVIDGFVYAGQDLADASRPVFNNDMSDNYSGEVVTDTGVNYTWTAGEALRSILFEDLSINPTEYNTISFRIRSLTDDDFFRWRIYIHSDLGGNLQTYKDDTQNREDYWVEILSDGTGTNVDLYSETEPDEDGWITVTFNVGELNYWKNASVIDGFRLGWVNFGTDQEIADVVLSLQ